MHHPRNTIAAILLFALLLSGLPVGWGAPPCQTDKRMACCKPVVADCATRDVQIGSAGCCCRIAERKAPQFPALNVADLGTQSFKKIKHALSSETLSSLNINKPRENPCKFELFYHPKFSSESKIYALVSSYLI